MLKLKLADPAHRLPWPGIPGRIITGDETIEVNPADPFFAACIRDGSLIPISPPAPPPSNLGAGGAPITAAKER